jgi:hypothetical protein
MNKRGTILVENVVFIIINLIFLSVLVIFLLRQSSGAIVLEQTYAKQIAMLVDSSKPVMVIKMDMEKGRKLTEKNGLNFDNAVSITGNLVKVKLSSKGGYSYAFFNDVDVSAHAEKDDQGKYTSMYIFTINKKGAGK